MCVPSRAEMLAACLAVEAVQFLALLRHYLRVRRALRAPEGKPSAPVSVIIPCKGAPEGLEKNICSILWQDYPAGAEFILVVPSIADPAYAALGEIVRRHPALKIKLLSSAAVPVRCSEQILNMLHGVRHASPETEVLAFADSDIRVPQGWLRELAGPLAEPEVTAVTAPLVFPPAADLCGNLRSVWVALGIPYLDLNGCVAGASFALRKKDFAALGVEELWGSSLNNDLSLAARIRRSGGKVRFAFRAMPVSSESCAFGPLFAMFNKWMFHFKYYFPAIWLLGAALTAFKLYAVVWGASYGWAPALVLYGLDALLIWCALRALEFRFADASAGRNAPPPAWPLPLVSAVCSPLLQLVYAANLISSCFSSRLRWGGYVYRVRGAGRVEVEGRT